MFASSDKIPIIKNSSPSDVPFWCPLCEQIMTDSLDATAYLDIGVCRDCESDFVDGHRQDWIENGYRPSEKIVIEKISLRTKKLS